MSTLAGKVSIDGVTNINGEKVFVLNMLQARNPDWVKKPFFAKYSESATWLSELRPAFGESKFFFQDELNELIRLNKGQLYFDKKNKYKELVDASINSDD